MGGEVIETIYGDRRDRRRYQIDLNLTFRQLAGKRAVAQGTGKLGDISSGGLMFETPASLPVTSHVELKIEWPYCSEAGWPLELLIVGRVVRAEGARTAVKIIRHELRRAASRPAVPVAGTLAASSH